MISERLAFVKQGPCLARGRSGAQARGKADQCQFLLGQHSVTFLDPRNFLAILVPPD